MSGIRLPMAPARRRRAWLVWCIWAVAGTALTLEGIAPDAGAVLALAFWVSAPFWMLFVAWPFLWAADRFRAGRLWGVEVMLAPAPDGTRLVEVVAGRDDLWVPEELLSDYFGPEAIAALPCAEGLEGISRRGILLSTLVRWRAKAEDRSCGAERLRDWVIVLIEAEAAARGRG